MTKLTHIDISGAAHMVDVGDKPDSRRSAVAEGYITMLPATLAAALAGNNKKGDVFATARIAGIMAAKKTADLIPLCHPLALTHVSVELAPDAANARIHCQVSVRTAGKTGVEMEALNGVQVALLTIYDMCKALDRGMRIMDVGLVEKHGGKSGSWRRADSD